MWHCVRSCDIVWDHVTLCVRSCDLFCSSVEQHSFDQLAPPPKRARERLVAGTHIHSAHTLTVCSSPPSATYTSLREKMVSESWRVMSYWGEGEGEERGKGRTLSTEIVPCEVSRHLKVPGLVYQSPCTAWINLGITWIILLGNGIATDVRAHTHTYTHTRTHTDLDIESHYDSVLSHHLPDPTSSSSNPPLISSRKRKMKSGKRSKKGHSSVTMTTALHSSPGHMYWWKHCLYFSWRMVVWITTPIVCSYIQYLIL